MPETLGQLLKDVKKLFLFYKHWNSTEKLEEQSP